VQADPAGRTRRGGSGHPLPGLGRDPTGHLQQLGQVVDRPAQPSAPPTRGCVLGSCCSQCLGLGLSAAQGRRAFARSFSASLAARSANSASSPVIRCTVACASSRPCAERNRSFAAMPLARRAAAVPQPGAGRATRGLDPPAGDRDPADRLGQQPRVGRVGHISRDHRGVRPEPVGPQQLGVRGLGQKRLVAALDCGGAAASRELHQRRRVRDLAIDRGSGRTAAT